MKTSQRAAFLAVISPLCAILPNAALAQGNGNGGKSAIPSVPYGSITAFPTIVKTGTHPTLTWTISHPAVVQEFVTIEQPATIVPKQTLTCEVRVLGAGVTASSSGSTSYTFVPTEAQVSYGGGSYGSVFSDTNLKVNPSKVVYTKEVTEGQPIRFGGRYNYNGVLGPYFNSQSGTKNVRTLVNGERPPTTYPLHTAPTLESFIKPYLDEAGNVSIGPMDVIVFMELTHTDAQAADPGYDLQDMVLLVTFTDKTKNNNGHGNNVDGVDSSNPGKAPFEDSDPNVDDEKQK